MPFLNRRVHLIIMILTEMNMLLFLEDFILLRIKYNIVAAFQGMHASPVKQLCMTTKTCDYRTDRHTDAGQSDPYIPPCFAGDTKIV